MAGAGGVGLGVERRKRWWFVAQKETDLCGLLLMIERELKRLYPDVKCASLVVELGDGRTAVIPIPSNPVR